MNLVSDNILIDQGQKRPNFDQLFPTLDGFELGDPNSWTKGHPHAFYKNMRETAPVMWTPMRKNMSGFWSITGYDDIKSVELAPKIFSSERGSMLLAVNPRSKWPAYVAKVRDRVAAKIDSLLDNMERQGPKVDFVKLFSQEVPMFTLCEMLGVDEAVMADRRANPRKDLLTVIAQSQMGGEDLPQEFLDGSWLLIIFAGNDTSRNSLSGTIRLLTEFQDQRQMVIEDPALIPKMTHEALRLVSPVQYMRRTAMEDTELNGQKIAKDEKVVMWYGINV